MDWHAWHSDYDRLESDLGRRLQIVQACITAALDNFPPGPVKVISLCGGQGRDVIGVLSRHPRTPDVSTRLVEIDPRNAATAIMAADEAGIGNFEVVVGDAALTKLYEGMTPAHLVLMCGIFGNIEDEDIKRTVDFSTELCRRGGTLVWTRHRKDPEMVPRICQWLKASGFKEQCLFETASYSVGVHQFTGTPRELTPDARMFNFVGYDALNIRAALRQRRSMRG